MAGPVTDLAGRARGPFSAKLNPHIPPMQVALTSADVSRRSWSGPSGYPTHWPLVQLVEGHTTPQAPQLVVLVERLTQTPPHWVWPAGHPTHPPSVQLWPWLHATPH